MRWVEVGANVARCLACGETAQLRIVESRYVRGLRDLLSPTWDPQASRTATCNRCDSTYPVRTHDASATDAARRTSRPGRDWTYADTA